MASNSEWLARKLLELEQQVQALGRGTRLGHSSLQGESILALDEDGEVLAELGTEGGAGGVVHLDGPEPPRPTAPVLEQGVGTIFVRWDGDWDPLVEGDDGELPTTPLDFDRIEVHATTDPEATEWDEDTLAGSITQRNGGVVMIRGWDIDDVVIVRLVCRSLADKLSEPSEPAEVTVTGIDIAAIVDELDAANLELSNLDGTMFAVGAELDALAITFKNLDTSIINTDDGTLAEALDDARQALEDVEARAKDYTDTGVADARAEIEAELDTVRTTADGKNKTFYRTTEPSEAESSEGDLWFDTDDDNRLYRHTGGEWVSAADGRVSAVQGAVDDLTEDLDTVRTTVDGKNSITWSPDTPSGEGKAGDTWFRTSGNNIIGHWRHSGSAWVSMSLDATVIPNLDAGKINSGHIDTARLAAGSITADKLMVGGAANLVSDPEFTTFGSSMGWATATGGSVTAGAGVGGSAVFSLPASSSQVGAYLGISEARSGYRAKVSGGTRYRLSAYVRASDFTPDDPIVAQLYLRFFTPADKAAGTFTWGSPSNKSFRSSALVDGEWTLISFEAVAPDGAVEAAPGLYKHSGHTTSPVEFCMPSLVAMTGATLIENGAITTEKIATGAITAESGVIGSLDAGKIVAGEMDGARIKAGTVTADKILVGGAGNLLTNPGFTGGGTGWNLATYSPIITESGGPTGEPVLSIQHSDPNSALFPYLGGLVQSAAGSFAPDLTVVEAGKRYAASVWVRAGVDIPVGNAGMGFRLRELGSATLGWAFPSTVTNREVIPANTWAKVEGEFLVPEDTGTWNRLAFGLRANGALNGQRVEFSAPVLLPMVGATLIENGAITADKVAADAIGARAIAADAVEAGKIAADSISGREIIANTVKAEHIASFTITADELAANSVSTDKLVANSVIADKLAANSVIAEKIDALAVTADKLAANAVTADKIAANAITAGKIDSDAINGMVITGATVRTNASGARVEMNAEGLVQYNAQGQPIVDMTGGTFSTVGSLQTGRPGDRRVIISNEVWNNPGTGIVFVPEDGEVAPAHASRIGTPYRKWLEIAVEEDWTTSGYRSRARFRDVSLELTHCAMTGTVQDGPYSTLRLGTHSTGTQNPGEWYLGSATKTPADPSSVWASHVGGTLDGVSLVSQDGFAWIRGGGNVQVDAGLGGARMDMQNSRIDTTAPTSIVFSTGGGGDLSISNDSTNPFMRSRAVMNRTYGYAANVYVTTSGILGKSTSARRYKTDEQEIAPAEYADALLSIPFKSWLDKKQVEQCAELEQFREDNPYCPTPEYLAEGAEGPARHVGAVAEDFIDAGLDQFVTFDQYGRVDGLQYDRIGVALIPIIKGMKEQIDRLEAANGIGE